jgi:glycosyltransferase involved in cell wall biosynthesis
MADGLYDPPKQGDALINAAYYGMPLYAGGTRTFFLNLRNGLADQGICLSWLGVGKRVAQSAVAHGLSIEAPDGLVVAPDCDDERAGIKALIDYVRDRRIPVVLLNSVAAAETYGLACCLPSDVRRILIMHNITPMTYRIARAMRDYVHRTVAPCPRIERDLVRHYGFDAGSTCCIPHGVGNGPPDREYPPPRDGAPLRVAFVGRVEDAAKGVLWLPEILDRTLATGANLRLTVAGVGPDLPGLREAVSRRGLDSRVEFAGEIPHDRVVSLFGRHDVFLMPSRYEGFGYVLLEAMAAGCVPVASRIQGVTDFVIQDGRTGFLFPVGSTRAAAELLARLARDPAQLAAAGAAGQADVRARFSLAQQAERYAGLIHGALERPSPIEAPMAPEDFSMPRGFRPGWWYWLPLPIKNALRLGRERFLVSRDTRA